MSFLQSLGLEIPQTTLFLLSLRHFHTRALFLMLQMFAGENNLSPYAEPWGPNFMWWQGPTDFKFHRTKWQKSGCYFLCHLFSGDPRQDQHCPSVCSHSMRETPTITCSQVRKTYFFFLTGSWSGRPPWCLSCINGVGMLTETAMSLW